LGFAPNPRRRETDYIFHYWSALSLAIRTFGIYGLYVFYQLVCRMRDHNAQRLELLDAATTVAKEQAGRQGLQQEMTPSCGSPVTWRCCAR
jgi:hypothetical protein